MWGEITYLFRNCNGCTVEIWEWIRNFSHTLKMMWLVIHGRILKSIHVSKRGTCSLSQVITWLRCFFPGFDRFIPGFDIFIPGFDRFIPASIPVTGLPFGQFDAKSVDWIDRLSHLQWLWLVWGDRGDDKSEYSEQGSSHEIVCGVDGLQSCQTPQIDV